jgi:excisionase family DNA binding protein
MRTSDARENWSGPVLRGASDGTTTETATPVPATGNAHESTERGQSIFLLTDYPDVGRVGEVATVLQCSKWCVYDLINTGALKSIRLGRAIRVTRRALEEFLVG